MVPARPQSAGLDPMFARRFEAQEVQRQLADAREVLSAVPGTMEGIYSTGSRR